MGGLVLGEKTMGRQRGVVGRGLEKERRFRPSGAVSSMCFIFARRHEAIEFD